MNWRASRHGHKASTPEGYYITWAIHPEKQQPWFNAYTPAHRCIEAGFDREVCKRACDEHHKKAKASLQANEPEGRESHA